VFCFMFDFLKVVSSFRVVFRTSWQTQSSRRCLNLLWSFMNNQFILWISHIFLQVSNNFQPVSSLTSIYKSFSLPISQPPQLPTQLFNHHETSSSSFPINSQGCSPQINQLFITKPRPCFVAFETVCLC
jgi:hypothetical protein